MKQPVIGFSVFEEIIRVTLGKANAPLSQCKQLLTSALHIEVNLAKSIVNLIQQKGKRTEDISTVKKGTRNVTIPRRQAVAVRCIVRTNCT